MTSSPIPSKQKKKGYRIVQIVRMVPEGKGLDMDSDDDSRNDLL